MSWIDDVKTELKRLDDSPETLKRFGWLVGGVLNALGGYFYYKDWFVGVSALLVLCGTLLLLLAFTSPRRLGLFYRIWMGLAFTLGWLMSRVLLALIFYVVLAPLGMAAKLFGKQFLASKINPESISYWVRKGKGDSGYEKMY